MRFNYQLSIVNRRNNGARNQTHRYLYGTQIEQVLSDETPTGMVWALADRLGTVSDLDY